MAAVLRVQATGAASGVADVTATLNGVQAGDMLVVCIYERDGSGISSVSDSVNGAWTLVEQRSITAAQAAIYFKANSGAGNPVVTVTAAGTSPRDINASAWSGLPTSVTADTQNEAGNSSVTAHTHGSITPSAASLIITCVSSGADFTSLVSYNTGFAGLDVDAGVANANRRLYAYKAGHTGTINPTHNVTTSVSSDGVVGAFVESSGGGALTWIPVSQSAGASRPSVVASGMTPRGSGA